MFSDNNTVHLFTVRTLFKNTVYRFLDFMLPVNRKMHALISVKRVTYTSKWSQLFKLERLYNKL